MSDNPYSHMPDRAFWSRAVSAGYDVRELLSQDALLLRASDRIASAGSCFAVNMIPYLQGAGYHYVRTETNNLPQQSDRFGYGHYSAAYGNIYTARQLLQLVQRCRGKFSPAEDRWRSGGAVIDPFRPGLPYPAESNEEFDALTASHLAHTRKAIEQSTVFIFTVGLTESWVSADDGAVFPACPGTIGGSYDPARHLFKNFAVGEVSDDLRAAIVEMREINPLLRVILTVSPVPLVATATASHVACATSYSKAVLRVACEEVFRTMRDVIYFPAYEIVAGSEAPDYFETDRRNVTRSGIETVMNAFFAHSERSTLLPSQSSIQEDAAVSAALLSQVLANSECEEMLTDTQLRAGRR